MKRPGNFSVIAVTEPYFWPGEADAIARALRSGRFNRVHIRKPGADDGQLRALLEAIPAELHPALSLHDGFNLAALFTIGGLHLNSRNPSLPDGFRPEAGGGASGGRKILVSRSFHSLDELRTGTSGTDYCFLSPVFPSVSKPGYGRELPLSRFEGKLPPGVIALGGVTPGKFASLRAAGFSGAAMLGAAWRTNIPSGAFALQYISHPDASGSVIPGVRTALAGGCRWVQLRHKDASPETLLSEGMEMRSLSSRAGAVMIVDDHVELVNRLGADGVHLGRNDMPVAQARQFLGPAKIIGATANTAGDIIRAAAEGADYIGLGPFRFTSTKANLSPVLGLEGYASVIAQVREQGVNLPVVAIGGIGTDDIPAIMACGVQGIAVSSAILSAPDPAAQTRRFISIINDSIKPNTPHP